MLGQIREGTMPDNDKKYLGMVVESAIRLAVLGSLLYLCLQITRPFLMIIIWAIVLAVAVYPLFIKLLPVFGNRRGRTSTVMVVITLAILIVPVVQLTGSIIDTAQSVNTNLVNGTFEVPPPNDSVKGWPLIGEPLHEAWSLASTNLGAAAETYSEQLKALTDQLKGLVGGFGGALFTFIFATIFAGVFMASGESGYAFTVKLMTRLAYERGQEFADLSVQTVRSVALGVVGVAMIQAILSGIGLSLIGVPAVGLWVLLVLVFAIAQLPPIIVLGPIMVWVFSVNETVPATIFMVYGMLISASDAFLKPLFLGRGMNIPMPVILIGAIGGMVYAGIIGLFIGAIVLALGYSLFTNWLQNDGVDMEPHDE